MRRRTLLAAGVLASLTGCGRTGGDVTVKLFPAGERPPAPPVTGTLLDGSPYTMLTGQPAVINFWASWCAPCRTEADDLQTFHQNHPDVTMLGVNSRDQLDTATAFTDARAISYPSLYDPSGHVALDFRQIPPLAIPATLIIDADGGIAAVFLRAVLASQLAEALRHG